MLNMIIKKLFRSDFKRNSIILVALISLIYLFISLYFVNHFFFYTVINGVNVSLKSHDEVDDIIRSYIKDYELQLIERKWCWMLWAMYWLRIDDGLSKTIDTPMPRTISKSGL